MSAFARMPAPEVDPNQPVDGSVEVVRRIPPPRAEPRAAVRMGRNFTWRVGAQVISSAINLAAMVLLGRHLAAHGYGEYAFWYSLIPVLSNLVECGVGIVVSREIARDPGRAPRLLGDALMLRGAMSALVIGLIVPIAMRTLPSHEAGLLSLVMVTALFDFTQDISVWVLRAWERLDLEALLLVSSQLVWFGSLAVGLVRDWPLTALIGAATLAYGLREALGLWIVVRRCRPRFEFDRARWASILRQGLPFGLAMFGSALYGRVGLLLLKALATPEDVAQFQVGFLLSQPFGFLSVALSVSVFPEMARYARHRDDTQSSERLRHAVRRATRYTLLLALPLAIALGVLATPLLHLLFHGKGFSGAPAALQITSLVIPAMFLNLNARYMLAALDRQREYLKAILVGALANLVIGAVLIPSMGFRGACFAYLGAELTIAVVCQRALAPHLGLAALAGESARPLAAAAVTAAMLIVFHRLPPLALVALCGIAYVALLPVLGAVSTKELRTLRQVYLSFAGSGGRA